jgi:hypothetical protein
MTALPELQAAFAAALLGDAEVVHAEVRDDGLAPGARLAIYRHHVLGSLTAALESTFPVVTRLVDVRFFRHAADRYVRRTPPVSPCLFEYGATFPDFLTEFPATRALAYLPDVARLEWALNVALHAPDVAPIEPDALRALPPVALHPSVTLLRSPWPVDAIWRANQPDADPVELDLESAGVGLQVWRAGDEALFRALPPADFAFRETLAQAEGLAAAAAAALAADAATDLTALVRGLLDEEVLIPA